MKRKALIISIKGTELSQVEKKLFSRHRPWGVILFRRNLRSIYQIKKLTSEIKKLSGSRKFPILIDEEGRSVSRLVNVINHDLSANNFGVVSNFFAKIIAILVETSPYFLLFGISITTEDESSFI